MQWHLTPELSRAERGGWEPVLSACREVSTKPRHGVGLNDLLGGKEAGEGEALAYLPKGRSTYAWARPANFQPDVAEAIASDADELSARLITLPKSAHATLEKCERAQRCHRSGNVPRNCPKNTANRS
jgi:hypothetical protein